MASDPPSDLVLSPINGTARTMEQWLTMFHLVVIVLDPYTNESSWILPTASRVIQTFEQADCRLALLLTASAADCRRFLGPMADQVLTFADPDRAAVKAFGLSRLPAIIHVAMDGTIVNAAEGWHPAQWRTLTEALAKKMSWSAPSIPTAADPGPFEGSPALA
ncbi:MAG: hypothetical protein QOF60_2477 [Actinomycetota bacterium]|jgi:hypothetical protein|nr:hypothetical protein [Actinomycetota bacterium]